MQQCRLRTLTLVIIEGFIEVNEGFILVRLKGGETPSLARVKYLTEFGVPTKTEHEYLNL